MGTVIGEYVATVADPAALPQVTATLAGVCKTVGYAFPGSNPGPATIALGWVNAQLRA